MKNILKNSVACYIYNKLNERGIKSFEKKVANILQENGIVWDIICHNAWMERASGRGSYYFCAEIEVSNEIFKLKSYSNDSIAWDSWNEPTSKEKRSLFLAVLKDKILTLKEEIAENLEYNELGKK